MIEQALFGGVVAALITTGYLYLRSGGEVTFTLTGDPREDDDATVTVEDDGTVSIDIDDRALEELTGIGPTRAEQLRNEGFEVAQDLLDADDGEILNTRGIGPSVLETIKGDLDE